MKQEKVTPIEQESLEQARLVFLRRIGALPKEPPQPATIQERTQAPSTPHPAHPLQAQHPSQPIQQPEPKPAPYLPVSQPFIAIEDETKAISARISKAHSEIKEREREELKQKRFEKELEEGSKITLEIIKRELEAEKERMLSSLRMAYRSEAFINFKKGMCSHEEFELELLRLLREK